MRTFSMELILESPCLIGSGEGFGSLIDSDIVFDELGIPYIPAKRVKGCLRDSAIEVCEMFSQSGIKIFDLSQENSDNKFKIVSKVFGKPGSQYNAPVYFSNLIIRDYEELAKWLKYLGKKYNDIFNRESIINQYTEIRQQTSIDEESGTAKKHSLRTIRVAKRGLIFEGTIDFEEEGEDMIKLIYFACENFRRFGTKRNRGLGKVKCELYENKNKMNFLNELEGICIQ